MGALKAGAAASFPLDLEAEIEHHDGLEVGAVPDDDGVEDAALVVRLHQPGEGGHQQAAQRQDDVVPRIRIAVSETEAPHASTNLVRNG